MKMEGKKNKIISISGEPVTGKGVNVKAIQKKLIEQGYTEDNIHIISAGHEFRQCFNEIINLIRNLENPSVLKDLSDKDELKIIIGNSKYRAQLIEAISKLKSVELSSNITIEQANNMPELAEIRDIVDNAIDEDIRKKGQEINKQERPNEIWIIDSRLAFKNIPDSFSVRLTCRSDVAGKRLLNDTSRGTEDCNYSNEAEAIEQREKRRIGEIARYKQRYGIDLTNEDNYDLIIDTSFSSVDDISSTILDCLEKYQQNKYVPKMWASPKLMLPLQRDMDTLKESYNGINIEDMIKSIESNGYDINCPIDIIEVDGKKYIIEGHHRNFAMGKLKKTLIPYEVIGKDDERLKSYSSNTARQRAKGLRLVYLTGHEQFFDDNDKKELFSYNNIYPNIYIQLKGKEKISKEDIWFD